MKKVENVSWGLVLVVLGLIFGLNSLGITNINVFFSGWWTLFIIVPSLIGIMKNHDKTWSFVWLVIGILLLLSSQNFIQFHTIRKLMLPLILVMIGLSIIFKDTINAGIHKRIKELNTHGLEEYYAVFSGQKLDLRGEEFKGASVNAVFGGMEIELRDAIIKEDVVLNISAVFGGVEIRVPQNVNVKVKSTPIFGGVSSKVVQARVEGLPTIYINAFCMFGGAEVK